MPYIELKTDKKISNATEEEFKKAFGKAIEIFPGKSERWLMINLVDECKMTFSGKTGNACMISVDLLGTASRESYEKMTAAASKIASELLDIPEDRIYIKYTEYKNWGCGKELF